MDDPCWALRVMIPIHEKHGKWNLGTFVKRLVDQNVTLRPVSETNQPVILNLNSCCGNNDGC